jgi:transposase
MSIYNASWTNIDAKVAKYFNVGAHFVAELRKGCSNNGQIIYHDGERRGRKSKKNIPNKLMISRKATPVHPNAQHSEDNSLTNQKLQNWLKRNHGVKVSKWTMACYIHKLLWREATEEDTSRALPECYSQLFA